MCAALPVSTRRRFHVNMGLSDDDQILAVTSNICCTLQLELVSNRLADYLIFGYFACLCCVVLPCVVWRNCVINFTVLLCIILMHLFYRVMKGIYQFTANLLSYIPAKYYWNRSTSDLVIVKSKRVNFLKHSVVRKWLHSDVLWCALGDLTSLAFWYL